MNSQQTMEEIDRLDRLCEAKDTALNKTIADYEEILSEAQAQIVIKDEALTDAIEFAEALINGFDYVGTGTSRIAAENEEQEDRKEVQRLREIQAATSETVAAWRAKETEPYKREVAMLHSELKMLCNTPSWMREWDTARYTLRNTQATALAYEREVENRGAVKALERLRKVFEQYESDELFISTVLDHIDIELRANNKGEVN